jgi:anti-anti-sigma factor
VFQDELNDFDIVADLTAEVARVQVTGELDVSSAPRLIAAVHDVAHPPVRRIDLECSGVSFLDSTGLRALLVARNAAVDRGVELTLVEPSASVQRVIEMTGVSGLLTRPNPS